MELLKGGQLFSDTTELKFNIYNSLIENSDTHVTQETHL
jgi:hypothetical protein